MFEVEWTGDYPHLCSGEWIIKKDGKIIELPKSVSKSHMGTLGTYSEWTFDENYCEFFEDYEDGLCFEDWIVVNIWVKRITTDVTEQKELYKKISEKDWRHNSCGGCI